MTNQTFPYKGWILLPSFKPTEKTFTGYKYSKDWHDVDNGKSYHISNIHPDKAAAIAWGKEDLKRQQEALDKKQASILKKHDALKKDSGEQE